VENRARPDASTLVAKGDRLLRKLLLRVAGDHYVRCITCSLVAPAKHLQVGHWIGRSKLATRYDLKNVSLQCQDCNYWHSGRPKEFEAALRKMWGDEEIDQMLVRSNERLELGELEQLINTLEWKLKERSPG
jgi:hypothetical protein